MGNVVFSLSVSLDGYMSGPNDEIDWHHVDTELHSHMNEWLGQTTAFLEGRRTFELMDDYWPTADQQPDATPVEVEFAGIWRRMPKVVYSTTLESASHGTTIKREVIPDEVRALSSKGDVVVGGPNLAKTFLALDLVDEVRLYVNPIVLGAGRPMFQSDTRLVFELIESRIFGNGVVLLRYQRR